MWPLRVKFGKHAGLYNRHTLFFLNDDINTDNDELGQGLCLFKTALYNKEQICLLLSVVGNTGLYREVVLGRWAKKES